MDTRQFENAIMTAAIDSPRHFDESGQPVQMPRIGTWSVQALWRLRSWL
jgi:hypothetical protein